MQKFTIFCLVLVCAIALASAAPSKKHGHKKSAKLVHASHKSRKSSKLVAKPLKHHRKSARQEVYEAPAEEEYFEEEVFDEVPEQDYIEVEEELLEDAVEARAAHQPHAASNYFNTHFESAHEGSIALANSYSTGQKGAAASHATSYGRGHPQIY